MYGFQKLFFILFFIPLFSCSESSLNYQSTIVQNQNQSFTVNAEIADTSEKMSLGLMNRQSLDENSGMLFVYDTEQSVSFWMKNTYVSLDIIFMDSQKKIVEIEKNTTPLSETLITPTSLVRYVLEVNAGFADTHALSVDDTLVFSVN